MQDLFIDAETVYERVQAGAKLIDVRSEPEFAQVAVPGAIHVPLHLLPLKIFEHVKPDDTVICYCLSGARSDQATRWLRQNGVAEAYNGGGVYPLLDAFDVAEDD
ncbi:MAG: rhodanese-like domain-containing protein [Deltaproteobacteria bacterium]|nr:rhodanese-like domain-containing protein [Deltaproteobacteria bacterium]